MRLNPKYTPAGKWWLEHRMRRQYRAVVFRPNEEASEDEYNIWRGLAVKPEPGEWPLLRRLIVEGLAGGDEALAKYIIRWSAFAVQNPGRPAEVALTFIGGKGTFARVLCRIFGQHGRHVAGKKSLTSNFNKHLHGCAFLFADEAVAPGDRDAAGLVKAFITEEEIMIEPKGVDSFPAPNRLKVIIASNDTYVVDASDDERRYGPATLTATAPTCANGRSGRKLTSTSSIVPATLPAQTYTEWHRPLRRNAFCRYIPCTQRDMCRFLPTQRLQPMGNV